MYFIKENKCIDKTPAVVRVNRLIELYIGQGEGDTKWKGCAWKLFLCEKDNLLLKLIKLIIYLIKVTFELKR